MIKSDYLMLIVPESEFSALKRRVAALEELNLLNVQQVATRLKRHCATVRKYFHEGKIETVRIGKRMMARPSAVEKFIAAGAEDTHCAKEAG